MNRIPSTNGSISIRVAFITVRLSDATMRLVDNKPTLLFLLLCLLLLLLLLLLYEPYSCSKVISGDAVEAVEDVVDVVWVSVRVVSCGRDGGAMVGSFVFASLSFIFSSFVVVVSIFIVVFFVVSKSSFSKSSPDMLGTLRLNVTCFNTASLDGSSPNFCAAQVAFFLKDIKRGFISKDTSRSACSVRPTLSSCEGCGG